jgi:membrane associated rhomboid family serine protease
MLALWVYGRRVEDVCGSWRFLVFYLTCGLFADIISTITRAQSDLPGIGASGAVFGIMGAYLILFPQGRIRTFVWLGVVPIRAYWIILYFFILEIPPAFRILIYQADYQVAHWAHLGGFFASLFVFLFLRPEAFHRYRNELPL